MREHLGDRVLCFTNPSGCVVLTYATHTQNPTKNNLGWSMFDIRSGLIGGGCSPSDWPIDHGCNARRGRAVIPAPAAFANYDE
jgi:hypothetical protein